MPQSTTHDVQVEVHSAFVPEQSSASQAYFFFTYRIQITNLRKVPIQLMKRHWIVTDGRGYTQDIKGDGVVGVQPTINPGDTFEYDSFCPLSTPTGSMKGVYEMKEDDGPEFQVQIPEFFLVEPGSYN